MYGAYPLTYVDYCISCYLHRLHVEGYSQALFCTMACTTRSYWSVAWTPRRGGTLETLWLAGLFQRLFKYCQGCFETPELFFTTACKPSASSSGSGLGVGGQNTGSRVLCLGWFAVAWHHPREMPASSCPGSARNTSMLVFARARINTADYKESPWMAHK
jgi:hypothetical protein